MYDLKLEVLKMSLYLQLIFIVSGFFFQADFVTTSSSILARICRAIELNKQSVIVMLPCTEDPLVIKLEQSVVLQNADARRVSKLFSLEIDHVRPLMFPFKQFSHLPSNRSNLQNFVT